MKDQTHVSHFYRSQTTDAQRSCDSCPAGAIHAEGQVTERLIYIVGLSVAENLFGKLTLLDPAESPIHSQVDTSVTVAQQFDIRAH